MTTHVGAVRSFDLGGPGAAGRRWAARCSCGALATTDAWPEALAFVTQHIRVTAPVQDASMAGRPTPDLRRVECWQTVVVGHNGNGSTPPASVVAGRAFRLVSSLVRLVLGLSSLVTRV